MSNSFSDIHDSKIEQAIIWKKLWEELGVTSISEWWIYVSENVAKA